MKRFKRTLKMIKQSKVLTDKEKKELIGKGIIEMILNSYKIIIKFPFAFLGIIFLTLTTTLNYLAEFFDLIEQIFRSICIRIEDWKEITLTNGQARERLIKEIKDNKTIKIK